MVGHTIQALPGGGILCSAHIFLRMVGRTKWLLPWWGSLRLAPIMCGFNFRSSWPNLSTTKLFIWDSHFMEYFTGAFNTLQQRQAALDYSHMTRPFPPAQKGSGRETGTRLLKEHMFHDLKSPVQTRLITQLTPPSFTPQRVQQVTSRVTNWPTITGNWVSS